MVVGTSSSGKSSLVFEILRHSDVMFTEKPVQIKYAYGAWQTKFTEMQQSIPNIDF